MGLCLHTSVSFIHIKNGTCIREKRPIKETYTHTRALLVNVGDSMSVLHK